MKIGFCVSGRGRLVEAILEARKCDLLSLKHVSALVSKSTDFESVARSHDIHLNSCLRQFGEEKEAFKCRLADEIARLPVDALFLTFDWLLPKWVIDRFPEKIINVHMGLLPAFPGRGAVGKALKSGMTLAGATIHRVDDGVDTGPIICQAITPITFGMSEEALGRALFKAILPLSIQSIRWLETDRFGAANDGRVEVRGASFSDSGHSPDVDKDIQSFSDYYLSSRFNN